MQEAGRVVFPLIIGQTLKTFKLKILKLKIYHLYIWIHDSLRGQVCRITLDKRRVTLMPMGRQVHHTRPCAPLSGQLPAMWAFNKPCGGQWWAQIFEYSNIRIKWLSNIIRICIRGISPVRIYSDICSYIFWQPNIFKNLFVNLWKSEYIRIFAQNSILIFAYIFLMKKYI